MMYRKYGKRVFDVFLSLVGIILLSPVFVVVGLWIKASSKGSILFVQKRVGKDFKQFNLYKFRSMIVDAEKQGIGITSSSDDRITKIGKVIRKTKIDELPQLFNVLKGDMSLVGPRPELKRYVEAKKDDYCFILTVKPGVTDNAAIAFRHEEQMMDQYADKEQAYLNVILPQKIALYREYIESITLMNDIKLILKTFKSL